jgi:hypothetical protein
MKKHLREDKSCLNCNATVEEKFCSRCGQENVEPKESLGHLVSHFFADLTHYDSKFYVTIKDLLFKPGFLTKEYLSGKRATYLHPIRMYMFISLLYFLVTLTFGHNEYKLEEAIIKNTSVVARNHIKNEIDDMLNKPRMTASDTLRASLIEDLKAKLHLDSASKPDYNIQVFNDIDYKKLRKYDSLQQTLPEANRDKGIVPWLYGRWLKTINHYGEATGTLIVGKTKHIIPKMMFVLLPLFALFLTLFYSRKKYSYTEHAIFSLHFHSAVFLIFLIASFLSAIFHFWAGYIGNLELLAALIYMVIALRNTYSQSVWVSIAKGLGLSLVYGVFILIGFIVVALSSLL